MATPAKVEITCKLSEVPEHTMLPNNQGVEFYLLDESDRLLLGQVKLKQWNKLLNHGFENWVASITGKLGETTERGTVIDNPAIQVFERKPKEAKETSEPAPAVAESATPAPSPQADAQALARVRPGKKV